jgi:hypothetical protein
MGLAQQTCYIHTIIYEIGPERVQIGFVLFLLLQLVDCKILNAFGLVIGPGQNCT